MDKEQLILVIQTEFHQKRDLVDINISWETFKNVKFEENNFYSTSCPHCDETFGLNILVKLKNDEMKDTLEQLETEFLNEETLEEEEFQALEPSMTFNESNDEIFEEEIPEKETVESNSEGIFECKICKTKLNSSYMFRMHKNIHTDKFKCDICDMRFIKREVLKRHLKMKHSMNDSKVLENKKIEEKLISELESEIVTEENEEKKMMEKVIEEPNRVELVEKVTEISILKNFSEEFEPKISHTVHYDAKDFPFQCEICFERFNSYFTFRIHKNIHTDKFKCLVCDTRFIKGERLRKHLLMKHTKEEIALAQEKSKTDPKTPSEIEKVLPEHGTLCATCGKNFPTTTAYFAHTQIAHKSLSFECYYCNRILHSRKTLKHHMIRTHSDKSDASLLHRCDYCSASYPLKRDLVIHLRAKHVPTEKKFTCEICQEAFIFKKELLDHQKSHENECRGRHKCEICEKTFNRLSAKKEHAAIHSEARNFLCTICGQKYKRKSYLVIHKRIHTGYRPYCCKKDKCTAKFYDSGSFRQHKLMHERKEKAEKLRKNVNE
ncbi:zinc finger protein 62 homolog [Culicoides brevitarsis]|uniref:zinc finger protein 62 homolog n=1 Tax=Culicoides brevitarsis TaxID=469753 RepID=UPI00307BD4AE